MKTLWGWVAVAAVSAGAAQVVIHHGTPIDAALPLIVVIVTAIAAVTNPAVQVAVPMLIAGEIAFADERLRLTWFGLVLGLVFAYALLECGGHAAALFWRQSDQSGGAATALQIAPLIAVSAIVLLRWIPLSEVLIFRELLLVGLAIGIVYVYRSTPLAVAIAVGVALFTPAVPLRTLVFPIAVLVVGLVLRLAGMPVVRATVLPAASVAVMLTFFAWSGALARGLPVLLRGVPAAPQRQPVHVSVGPGETTDLAVPAHASSVIVSGANIPRLRRGALLGYIEPGRREVRVGDVADWGVLRREEFFGARIRWPDDPAGLLRGYGQTAWIDGAGRVPVPPGASVIYVSGGPTLDFDAQLQVDAFELRRP